MPNFEQPQQELTGDTPLKIADIDIVKRPTTPTAYKHLKEKGVDIFNPELYLFLINKAEDLGRQLTKQEVEDLEPQIEDTLAKYREQQEFAESLPEGWTKDRVVDIEVLHEPNSRDHASIRIRAITEKGYKVIIRTVKDLKFEKITEKKEMAEQFARSLIGQEIEFSKLVSTIKNGTGRRVYLRANIKKLPDFQKLNYDKLVSWYRENKG